MRRDDAWLVDMLQAAREAVEFANGLSFAEFEQNRMVQLAILKAMEIVGEAASHVGTDAREAYSEIPWPEIVGMRNRLVHGYFNVNLKRVWETVQQDIPKLISQLERLAPPES